MAIDLDGNGEENINSGFYELSSTEPALKANINTLKSFAKAQKTEILTQDDLGDIETRKFHETHCWLGSDTEVFDKSKMSEIAKQQLADIPGLANIMVKWAIDTKDMSLLFYIPAKQAGSEITR